MGRLNVKSQNLEAEQRFGSTKRYAAAEHRALKRKRWQSNIRLEYTTIHEA